MITFHGFIKENCIDRKVKWNEFHSYTGYIKNEFIGVVEDTQEDCLYIRLDNGKLFCGLMRELEMADASIEWLS